jgi:rubrerythrin
MGNESVDEILEFAIAREQEAVDFYTDLAGKAENARMVQVFKDFAQEEAGHKEKLESVKAGQQLLPAAGKVTDLRIADYTVDVKPDEATDYQNALILAMKREKASFRLYSDLAATTDDDNVRTLFESLAQEEAKHKLRFEIEYDEHVLTDN